MKETTPTASKTQYNQKKKHNRKFRIYLTLELNITSWVKICVLVIQTGSDIDHLDPGIQTSSEYLA